MLVLTRKTDETIHVGDDVVFRILGVIGDRVRVGIEAPKELSIRRGEHVRNDQERERRK